MLCFARLIRCAIVASGTRNALAISVVVRPPTARNVSAMADGRVSAGWQHMKRRTSASSSSTGCFVGRRYHVLFRRCFEDDLRFAPAARRLRPDLIGELPSGDLDEPRARIFGHAGAWPLERGSGERFLHGVLRGAEVAVATDDGAEHLRGKLTEQVLAGRSHRGGASVLTASRAARSSPDAPRS